MKNIFLLLIIGFSFLDVSAQPSEGSQPSQGLHEYYSKKRSTNKIVGWSMIGAGIGMAAAGYAINMNIEWDQDPTNNNKGVWLTYVGGATTLASIPFFIAANKNKRKAKLELKEDTVLFNNAGHKYIGLCLTVDF